MIVSVMDGGRTPIIGIATARGYEAAKHQRALATDHDETDARGDCHRERRQNEWG
jgi:hypothetical protein